MRDVNLLKDYRLTDAEIIDWAATLHRLRPWVTPALLRKVLDKFLVESDFEWERTKGIQNIFYAVVRVKE